MSGIQIVPTRSNTSPNTISGDFNQVQINAMPKQYVVGTTYTNGTPMITSTDTGATIARGVLIPYLTIDGSWRLRGSYTNSAVTPGVTSRTDAVSGIMAKNIGGFFQPLFGFVTSLDSWRAFFNPGTANISIQSATSDLGGSFVFDIELDAKPTWAD